MPKPRAAGLMAGGVIPRGLSVVGRNVPSMPEDELPSALERLCRRLPLRHQASLLRDPEQALSMSVAEELSRDILVVSESSGLHLAPTLIGQLTDIRGRLNVWWERLDPDDRARLIETRNDELDVDGYAGLVDDMAPQMIRVYVEMKASDAD